MVNWESHYHIERCKALIPPIASNELILTAYRLFNGVSVPIVPAPNDRSWMKATKNQFANRCLPLLIANQAGWFILNTHAFQATWNGGHQIKDVVIQYLTDDGPGSVLSHFGSGIITWNFPYLFRTPRDYNLLVRGPANCPKDGVCPLEGLVETDWADATFTMNWKFTRPNHPVQFEVGEPICMIVPQRKFELEAFRPMFRDITSDPETQRGFQTWSESRHEFLENHPPNYEGPNTAWQKHYFHGNSPSGSQCVEHQVKLNLRSFKEQNEIET